MDISEEKQIFIEKKVKYVLDNYYSEDLNSASSIDIIKLAKNMGFVLISVKMAEKEDGFILIDEKSNGILNLNTDKLIGINDSLSPEWKRFTIAHELGHYMLDYMADLKRFNGRYANREHIKGKNNNEQECDHFAACLLMPKDKVNKSFQEIEESLDINSKALLLSKKFKVTELMALRRMEELGLS